MTCGPRAAICCACCRNSDSALTANIWRKPASICLRSRNLVMIFGEAGTAFLFASLERETHYSTERVGGQTISRPTSLGRYCFLFPGCFEFSHLLLVDLYWLERLRICESVGIENTI